MILRNHGLLSCGPTIADAFTDLYHLQRACEVQIAAQAGGTAALHLPPIEVARRSAGQHAAAMARGVEAKLLYGAMMRWMIDKDPGFLD